MANQLTAARKSRRGGPRRNSGRPPLPANQRLPHKYSLALNDAQNEQLRALAQARRITPQQALRALLLNLPG